jgi:two-component system nitrogen regulation response regulator GlnG
MHDVDFHASPSFGPVLDPDATTQKRSGERPRSRRVVVPCLTIVAHAQPQRIGERALLGGLLVRPSVEISRLEPEFAPVDGTGAARALEDRYLSRRPACLVSRSPNGELTVEPCAEGVTLDGRKLDGPRPITREELARGVLLTLGDRAALLLHETSNPAQCPIDGIVGSSDAIALLRSDVLRLAATTAPVLVRGESGSGKECVARAIHQLGPRAEQEWIAVNMAAVPESMAAATLFGHARGAFTGAQQRHRGVFERAAGGTLFLDEIGETAVGIQPMLLRALETGKVLPIGEECERAVDVRVVAATDADLEREVVQGSFKVALLHRLAGHEVRVPPLRERRDDIVRLLVHFLEAELRELGSRGGLSAAGCGDELPLPVDLVTQLVLHPLPGNARQLRNLARHLALAARGKNGVVLDEGVERLLALPPPSTPAAEAPSVRRAAEVTDEDLLAALEQNGWSPGKTAQSLSMPTSTLHDLMQRFGIRRAADLSEDELSAAAVRCGGEVRAMAQVLRVSERALRLAMRQRRLRA